MTWGRNDLLGLSVEQESENSLSMSDNVHISSGRPSGPSVLAQTCSELLHLFWECVN